jgi:hypothetical protein
VAHDPHYRGTKGADILPDEHAFGWWFSGPEKISKHGKRNKASVGSTHVIHPRDWHRLKPGQFGFHASLSPLDALVHAPDTVGLIAWYVEISGKLIYDPSEHMLIGGRRRYLAEIPADDLLIQYAVGSLFDTTGGRSIGPDDVPQATQELLRDSEYGSVKKGVIGAGFMMPPKHAHGMLHRMLLNEVTWF